MPVSALDAEYVRAVVLKHSAILLDATKDYLIESRLERVVEEKGLGSVAELVSRARQGEQVMRTTIVEAIATHETFFFRDVMPFEVLKQVLLPRLEAARSRSRSLTIWSAACSSGQEAYSIAMLVHEHFAHLASWPIRIIATDLSAPILARARLGRFSQIEVNRGLPAAFLVKYFDRVGAGWVLKEHVRNLVEFSQANLTDAFTLAAQPDIVLMRNVLIYFDLHTKRSILERVLAQLPYDGALLLGAAETTLNVCAGFDRVDEGQGTYYRRHR